jgi:hypothetical protein
MQRRSPRPPSPHVSPQSHAPAPAVSVTRLRDNRALRSASDVVAPSEQELRKLALARADFDFVRTRRPAEKRNPEKRARACFASTSPLDALVERAPHPRRAFAARRAFGQTHDAPVTPGVAPTRRLPRARPPSRAHARPRRPPIRGKRGGGAEGGR